jgi:hypothetical protein
MEARWMWWRRVTAGGAITAMVVALAAAAARACMDYRARPAGLVARAASDDPAVAKAAAERLRAMGPEGLGVLMYVYDVKGTRVGPGPGAGPVARGTYPAFGAETLRAACAEEDEGAGGARKPALNLPRPGDAEHWKRVLAAVDAVAAQKDAAASGLYWYTSLDEARAVARRKGKPILSLHLLGRLDEEFSCANSRFFRTLLYPNAEVSAALRDRFVLHWQSERPVPKVTIDMGDGRVIERTVTGNSVHYVLDAEGRPVDAIPGLYGPKAFLRSLAAAEGAAKQMARLTDDGARRAFLARWHAEQGNEAADRFNQDLLAVNAVSKSAAVSPETWAKVAALPRHREDAALDATSRNVVRMKNPAPNALEAGRRAMTKAVVEDPLARVLANLERSVALDTVHNEFELHRRVHEWFAGRAPQTLADDVAPLNEKVYAELFLTPRSDPWLGLAPADAYSALEGGGVKVAAK